MANFGVSSVEINHRPLIPSKSAPFADKKIRVEAHGVERPLYSPSRGKLPAHGLALAVHVAFADHYPLVLRPDDVWLTISQGFATHVNENTELLRDKFVKHEGKAIIRLIRDGFIKGDPNNNWVGCFSEFSDQIASHIGKARDLLVSNFSTTTMETRAASEIQLMGAMKGYFDYRVMTKCGIPEITLLGTPEDWKSIRARVQAFDEYGLQWWTQELLPILDQLIEASYGVPDVDLWKSLYKIESRSGGDQMTGWLNVFYPYITRIRDNGDLVIKNEFIKWGQPHSGWNIGISLSDLPSGVVSVPFLWEYLGTDIPMNFIGGFAGIHQNMTTMEVRPVVGWGVQQANG